MPCTQMVWEDCACACKCKGWVRCSQLSAATSWQHLLLHTHACSPTLLVPLDPHPCSWLYLALQHPLWSPQQHHRFLPPFLKAAATLLLVAHRGSRHASTCKQGRSGGGSGDVSSIESHAAGSPLAALLGSLPAELLLHIIGLAAYPLSAWAPLDLGRQCRGLLRRPAEPWWVTSIDRETIKLLH